MERRGGLKTSGNKNRRIGLLGGSFNPAHEGHREISRLALERLGLDAVWWLVSPGNPLKDQRSYAPYSERLKTAREVSSHPNIIISDFENRHGLQYTVETLDHIKALNPDVNFVWLMGADSLESFHRWKDWMKIAAAVPIAVFNRPGFEDHVLNSEYAKHFSQFRQSEESGCGLANQEPPVWTFFEETENPISSTEIRKRTIRNSNETVSQTDDLHAPYGPLAYFLDLHPDVGDFSKDAIEGLSASVKSISPKYFYDERGSKLFDQITKLEEYYPTRTEKKAFLKHAKAISNSIGAGAAIFEYGSGSSEKVEWLARGIENASAYVAMDISREHLLESAETLASVLPVPVAAICADFHAPIHFPQGVLPEPGCWLGYFPGSTIGNMLPETAVEFLKRASVTLGEGAQFLIGVDLVKDKAVLEAAYNDKKGVTAAFNKNLLLRMQNELGAQLEISDFEHHAFYNESESRIEMHLRAERPTAISLDGRTFSFDAGETLHTENSHKFTVDSFETLVNQTPWRLDKHWTDERAWYAACLLSNS
ncbi:L-histidine N(alpha)-methyltransferase [Hyphococcus flavus]|uniref:Probable nicotinate-nucleotide adenylyltransferase n=1 Tax=Hyphococcus flavus TaxID=1866326 RepID=A0AAE9ZFJ3_9PROT|nr:L-histidine N(alpha)-methyltransferase [Hyphococcus flavus]WDI32900.1 L-histidine N(alpha)-methyltransferase [Hyphococcus flavus]